MQGDDREAAKVYQRRLLALLREGAAPNRIRAVLLQDPALTELRGYIEQLDDRGLEVAVALRRKWGGR